MDRMKTAAAMKCRGDEQKTLVESPMAKPANQDPSDIISSDPDPETESGSDPAAPIPDPKLDPPMFGSDPDRDPSALVAPGAVVVVGSFDDF